MPDDTTTLYGRDFFDSQSFNSLKSARIVLPDLFRHVSPQSVVDIGCGVGSWLSAIGDMGVAERLGVDGSYVERVELMIPAECFLDADLAKPGLPATIAARRPGKFDLAMCLEVAEHLPFERSASLVAELCELADLVLFSAAIPFQHGTGHINEQWPEFWATQFRASGFACFDLLRPELWGRSGVDWWYAQNVLVFARTGSAAHARLPDAAAVATRPLARIHPEAWLSDALSVWHPHRGEAREEELYDLRALLHGWADGAELLPPLRAIERSRRTPAGARNVFPFTRTETADPERLIAEAEAKGRTTRADLAALQRESATHRDELAALRQKLGVLEAERDAEQARSASLAAASEQSRTELLAAASGIEAERHRVAELEASLEQSRTERDALVSQLAAERARGEQFAADLADWESKASDYDTERGQANDVAAALKLCRHELEALQGRYTAECGRSEALHVALGKSRAECQAVKADLAQVTAELSDNQGKLVALDKRAAVLQAANTTLRATVAKHDDVLRDASTERAEALAAVQTLLAQARNDRLQVELDAQARVDAAEAALAAVLRSTSWRVAAPLRTVKRLFG